MLLPEKIAELNQRKAQGRAYLEANKTNDALRVYARILRDYPEDIDAYLFIGDCYLADGDGETAFLLYDHAYDLNPSHNEVRKRRKLAQLEWDTKRRLENSENQGAQQSVSNLLQMLSGREDPISEEEIQAAAALLQKIVTHPNPAQMVSDHLEQIDSLLPALIELNVRQAHTDGRPDLAKALQGLQTNIQLQMGERRASAAMTDTSSVSITPAPSLPRVLFLSPSSTKISYRQTLPAEALSKLGCEVTVANQFPPKFESKFDVVVAYRPHGDASLIQGLAACATAGIRIILDLDADFELLPVDHPDYENYGLDTPARIKSYATTLMLADQICVPNQILATAFEAKGYPVKVIPDGWSESNILWSKPTARRSALHVGLIGQPGQIEDILQIRRVILRTMREFSFIKLVVIGDLQTYRLFDGLPESRRLFLPPVNLEDYPYLLGQTDILLRPLRNTLFNQALSDRQLMEAGIRKVPWIAPPLPEVLQWEEGGLLASSLDEWYISLCKLVQNAELREKLGWAGYQKARAREMQQLAGDWLDLVNTPIRLLVNNYGMQRI
jgi:glycosyltransferase involved in cell wall biosynthesis